LQNVTTNPDLLRSFEHSARARHIGRMWVEAPPKRSHSQEIRRKHLRNIDLDVHRAHTDKTPAKARIYEFLNVLRQKARSILNEEEFDEEIHAASANFGRGWDCNHGNCRWCRPDWGSPRRPYPVRQRDGAMPVAAGERPVSSPSGDRLPANWAEGWGFLPYATWPLIGANPQPA